jgi:hypothetical protein
MAKQKADIPGTVQQKEELEQTLISNPEITEVHFNAAGGHHLNVHAGKDGKKYGQIIKIKRRVPDPKTGDVKEVTDEYPNLKTMIVKSVSRADVLGTEDK